MKIKFLIAGLFCVASASKVSAQKYLLTEAKEKFDKYLMLSKVQATYAEADKNLVESRTAIDKVAVHEKTAQLPLTFALKAAMYSTYAMRDTLESKTLPLYTTAAEALAKAKELDAAGENKALISEATRNLAQYQLNKGVTAFQAKSFDAAFKAFDAYHQISPNDTTAIYYSGLAAIAGKNVPAAIKSYTELLPLDFSKKETIYLDLSSLYFFDMKDTVNALKTVTAGIEKFPSSGELRKREIEISLQSGKAQEVLGKIEAAIANDPKNKNLYYYAGLVYTTFGNNSSVELDKLKETAGKNLKESLLPAFLAKFNPVQTKKQEYMTKAADMYKKALELDPAYYEANLNLGYALLSPAIDSYNYANNYLPPAKQKEYNAMLAKSTAQSDLAKPYLVKATELQPKNIDAWRNLKNYYLTTRNMAEANKVQKTIDGLK
ncbi:tetratricopeptide repeat protein [Mucilaginibacter antarcticus]|uniref:Tetratricopeptide repeat protein n=1 Tax=Mucilaginibacter antarcticus TaxID=1855725 RepID=A0ABW5XUX0_9SPHI